MNKPLLLNADYLFNDDHELRSVENLVFKTTNKYEEVLPLLNNPEYGTVLYFMSKVNFDLEAIFQFVQWYQRNNYTLVLVIDASEFSEEDNFILDDVIESISDALPTFIHDDKDELKQFITANIIAS
jgi:hypothetical protein